MKKKEFRTMQVSSAPVIYAWIFVAPYQVFLNSNSLALHFLVWGILVVALYFDRPFVFILRRYRAASWVFFLNYLLFSFVPALNLVFFGSKLGIIDLGWVYLLGGVFMFAFVLFFYSSKRLERNGWTNISGNVN